MQCGLKNKKISKALDLDLTDTSFFTASKFWIRKHKKFCFLLTDFIVFPNQKLACSEESRTVFLIHKDVVTFLCAA